jgi:hypothetical protein
MDELQLADVIVSLDVEDRIARIALDYGQRPGL